MRVLFVLTKKTCSYVEVFDEIKMILMGTQF